MPISTIDSKGLTSPLTSGVTTNTVTSAAATALTLQSAGTTAVTIDTSQNVGIGTASPSGKLNVSDATSSQININSSASGATRQILFSASTNSQEALISANNATGELKFESGRSGTSAYFQTFYTNNTERMRIGPDGNVMIGASSFPAFGSGPKLYVQGNGNGISVGYGTATSQYRIMYFNSGDATMYFHNNSNYAYLSGAGAWTNASDARLKKNIVDIKYGLADVLKAQPRSYQMHDVAGDFVGFIAQELKEIIPEVVSGDPEKQLGVDYGSLVAVAFKAIQELKTIVDAQAAEIAELKAKVA